MVWVILFVKIEIYSDIIIRREVSKLLAVTKAIFKASFDANLPITI